MAFDWFRRQMGNSEPQPPDPQDPPAAAEPEAPADTEAEAATAEPEVAEDYLKWAQAAYQNLQKRQQTTPSTSSNSPSSNATSEPEPPQAAPSQPDEVSQAAGAATVESSAQPAAPAGVTEAAIAVSPVAEPQSPESQTPESQTPESQTPEPTSTEPLVSDTAIAPSELSVPSIADPAPAVAATEVVAGTGAVASDQSAQPEASPAETGAAPAQTEPAPLPFWAQAQQESQERLERLRATAIVEPEPEVRPAASVSSAPAELTEALVLDEGFLWSAEVLAAQGRRPDQVSIEEITWLKRLRQGLDKTRRGLINQLKAIVGQGPLNDDAVMEIEAALLQADVGVEATDAIIAALQERLRQEVLPPEQAIAYLKQLIRELLDAPLEGKRFFYPEKDTLNIWLITGVNGAGKTTTIGKLAHIAQKSDYNCLIAAADTFRAAAVEQVKVWGSRSGVEVIANPGQNTDPAAVVFDAIAAAQSRGTELLLVDTAGRLQNKKNLMDELSKVRRIIDKKAEGCQVESLLVLDATLGQNGLRQAQVFAEAAQLSGVVLTKLDGTAKGGIALAVVKELGLPIRFIGAGEGIEDLRPFSSYEFVEALLNG